MNNKYKFSDKVSIKSRKSSSTISSTSSQYLSPECKKTKISTVKKAVLLPAMKHYDKEMRCEKLKGKITCDSIEMVPKLKTDKKSKCSTKFEKIPCKREFRDEFCVESTECLCPDKKIDKTPVETTPIRTSLKLYDTAHKPTTSKHTISTLKPPCSVSYFDDELDNVYLGKCTEQQKHRRPPKRPNWRPEFTLTENPRLTQCLRNPYKRITNKDKTYNVSTKRKDEIIESIKLVDNLETSSESDRDTSKTCIELDLENPAGLDFQGKDYAETYAKDEQLIEDDKEYLIEKRHIYREKLKKEIKNIYEEKTFHDQLNPKCFDIKEHDTDEDGADDVSAISYYFTNIEGVNMPAASKNLNNEIIDDTKNQYSLKPGMKMGQMEKNSCLYRTADKSLNKQIAALEFYSRYSTYYELYSKLKRKEKQQAEEKAKQDEIIADNFTLNLAQKEFNDFLHFLTDNIKEIHTKYDSLPHIERKIYPHTLREVKHLKRKLKNVKRDVKCKAIMKKEFFDKRGINKSYLNNIANLKISDSDNDCERSTCSTISEQTTDDEDEISVGPKVEGENFKYYLRGFHFKLGKNLRGKLHKREKVENIHSLRTCQTRSQWFRSLVPNKEEIPFFQYNPPTLKGVNKQLPDNPKFQLFPTEIVNVKKLQEEGPIRKFLRIPIGKQYDRPKRKVVQVKKPKFVKVKTFNLQDYLFRKKFVENEKEALPGADKLPLSDKNEDFTSILEYLRNKEETANLLKKRKRRQRMHYLGIPFRSKNVSSDKNDKIHKCESILNTAEDVKWIPPLEESIEVSAKNFSTITMGPSGVFKIGSPIHELQVHNKPAPKFREPTLKQHPRRMRSEVEDDMSNISTKNEFNVPRLVQPDPDTVIPYNLELEKNEYVKLTGMRHHHDHYDPKQHKVIRVRYSHKIPAISIDKEEERKDQIYMKKVKKEYFKKAEPQNSDCLHLLRSANDSKTMRSFHIDNKSNLECFKNEDSPGLDDTVKGISSQFFDYTQCKRLKLREAIHDLENSKGKYSNDKNKLKKDEGKSIKENPSASKNERKRGGGSIVKDFKQKYLDTIKNMATEVQRELKNVQDKEEDEVINRDEYIKEFNEEIRSIQSCVTSLEDSIYTNFTYDSGSYIMLDNKKVPLDYIRKSLVPFEEIDRCRIKGSINKPKEEYYVPYTVLPFSGQKHEQKNLFKGTKSSDKFFTYNTRIGNDLRKRLEVEAYDRKKMQIYNDKISSLAKVGTDLDENCIHNIEKKFVVKNFKVKSSISHIKNLLRKKFEICTMQSKQFEYELVKQQEENYYQEIYKIQNCFMNLFNKWQKKFYDKSIEKIYMTKDHYEITRFLREERNKYEKMYSFVNMQIVFTEHDWIKLTILQNFHYLIMKNSWREKYDWIHRRDDGTLEDFSESIKKRNYVNIRAREHEGDNAWAIKKFYEEHFLNNNNNPIMIVFPDAESFFIGVGKLKKKTFLCLREFHFTVYLLLNSEKLYNQYLTWNKEFIKTRSEFVYSKIAKRRFMEDRAEYLENTALNLLDDTLIDAVQEITLTKIKVYGDVAYNYIIPENIRLTMKKNTNILNKLAMLFGSVYDVLGKLDQFPDDNVIKTEKRFRKKIYLEQRHAETAYKTKNRIQAKMEQIKRNMDRIIVKPKKVQKYSRMHLRKPPKIEVVQEEKVSRKMKFFLHAFVEDDKVESDKTDYTKAHAEITESFKDSRIPFYFDHFLRLNDYEPNYDFKTKVETIYGPEEKTFKYKNLLPEIYDKMEAWQTMKNKKMEEDIKNSLEMYTDVHI